MAKVIESYVPKNSEFVRACSSAPIGKGYRVLFADKEVTPGSTGWRRPWLAPGKNGVSPFRG
jgi:hypothetical protein